MTKQNSLPSSSTPTKKDQPVGDQCPNLVLWNKLENVEEQYRREFEKEGRKLTALDPLYGRMQMTSIFGPCGTDWGYRISDWHNRGSILACKVTLWYKPCKLSDAYPPELVAEVEEYGGTLISANDDDAYKKTVTDALSRCFMALGHGAKIFLGRYDANKYMSPQKSPQEKAQAPASEPDKSSQGKKAQTAASESVNPYAEFLEIKFQEQPLLKNCEYKCHDGRLYFLTGVDDNAQSYIEIGFKESAKYSGGLFLDMPLPPEVVSYLQNQGETPSSPVQ